MSARPTGLDLAWHERAVSRDASELADNLRRQELIARQMRDDVAVSRPVVAALWNIAAIDFTPLVAAHIAAVLSAKVAGSPWAHFEKAANAVQSLDDAHDLLEDA